MAPTVSACLSTPYSGTLALCGSISIIGPDLETVHEHAEWIPLDTPTNYQKQTCRPSTLGYLNCLQLVQAFRHHTVQQHHVTFRCD